ncbi:MULTISPECIES: TetR/AcrR family transcriptional regulator [unclassified Polaromonas]|uniref:TetR/AcrR family transcriptional regulator n=1 Tax=unclassified Polaromonas TaxID=2638319 RepID=UPI000F094BD6|nr:MULTISPECIES: TetR/AcrR family transcriptional regulator [unclassified Polaromonas]AYQ29234.1 TetR/AcrR family transcriptional regulator [Polaromonas sp. SP1]QGJ19653.1 TetR family transcriptional regulator [Polaromonas sp. Pch-P]
MSTPSPAKQNAGSTRERLLDAAATVFLAHGFTAASMDMVRQEAGVSNGSLYHHFPTKAQLADALYAHILRSFHAALLPPITGRAVPAEKGVKGLIRAYIQWVLQNPQSAQLLHALRRSGDISNGADGPNEAERDAVNAEAFGTLTTWIAQRVEAGEMRAMPFHVWMALVFSPALSLTQRWVSQPQPAVAPKVRAALEHGAWMAVAA